MKLTYIPWVFSAVAAVAAADVFDDLCVPYIHHDEDYTLQLLCPHSETNIPANDCVDNDNGKLVARPYGKMGESCTNCNVDVLPSVSDVYLRCTCKNYDGHEVDNVSLAWTSQLPATQTSLVCGTKTGSVTSKTGSPPSSSSAKASPN